MIKKKIISYDGPPPEILTLPTCLLINLLAQIGLVCRKEGDSEITIISSGLYRQLENDLGPVISKDKHGSIIALDSLICGKVIVKKDG